MGDEGTMTKRENFAVVMTMLGETYGRALTDAMLDGYWLVLEDLSETELKAAARGAISTQKFMPTPAELLAYVKPKKDPNLDAIQAWQVVRKAIDKFDYLVATIDFGPLVNAVIRNLGGWDTLCRATLSELDNPGWLRKRFEEVYRSLSTADAQTLHGEPLAGALPPKWDEPKHVCVPLDGSTPLLRIEANGASDTRASIAAHIEGLADGLSEP
jgi:hypothetical protein